MNRRTVRKTFSVGKIKEINHFFQPSFVGEENHHAKENNILMYLGENIIVSRQFENSSLGKS